MSLAPLDNHHSIALVIFGEQLTGTSASIVAMSSRSSSDNNKLTSNGIYSERMAEQFQ